jgi:hypothetical protein
MPILSAKYVTRRNYSVFIPCFCMQQKTPPTKTEALNRLSAQRLPEDEFEC